MSAVALDLVSRVADALTLRDEHLAVAESCTGGLLSAWLTARPGSSAWFEGGLVTYSNTLKQRWLDVPDAALAADGAVSAATVTAMTQGVLANAPVQWAIAISGIAGPDGGTPSKPVGTVWIAWQGQDAAAGCSRFRFGGDREEVRRQSAMAALHGLLNLLDNRGAA